MAYIYLGHGKEELLFIENRYIPHVVETTQTLCTITKAGLVSRLVSVLQLTTISKEKPGILYDPLSNYNELAHDFIGTHFEEGPTKKILSENSFHISTGSIVEKYCDFLFAFSFIRNKISLFKSGLYDLSKDNDFPILDKSNYAEFNRTKHSIGVVDPEGNISIDLIRRMYNGSIYPTINSILRNINKLMKMKIEGNVNNNNYPSSNQNEGNVPYEVPYELFVRATKLSCKKTVSELMTTFPGIHYFFVCRVWDKDDLPVKTVSLMRKNSNRTAKERHNYPTLKDTTHGKDIFERIVKGVLLGLRNFSNKEPLSFYMKLLNLNMSTWKNPLSPARKELYNILMSEINKYIEQGDMVVEDIPVNIYEKLQSFNNNLIK